MLCLQNVNVELFDTFICLMLARARGSTWKMFFFSLFVFPHLSSLFHFFFAAAPPSVSAQRKK